MDFSALSGILEYGREVWKKTDAIPLQVIEAISDRSKLSYAEKTDNRIVLADNLGYMKTCMNDGMAGKIDLIYIDPPFFTKQNYEAEIKLTWEKGNTIPALKQETYDDFRRGNMDEYLRMLAPRLFGMRELLADTGSMWIHLDWHAVHYVKVLMDGIFGEKNFVNEVVWNYKSGGVSRRRFARKHDTLLCYSKTSNYYFKAQQEKSYNRKYKPYRFKGVKEYRDDLGWYTLVNMKDVWLLDMVGRTSSERTGYTTQKPESLMLRILESCTKEGDLCADFFGGSGTMAAAAEKIGRRWLQCDSSRIAVINAQKRLSATEASFEIQADERLFADLNGNFSFELDTGEALASDRLYVNFRLIKYVLPDGAAPLPVETKHIGHLEHILNNDSLQLVDYYCIDFDFDGKVLRPWLWRAKGSETIENEVSQIISHMGKVAVRVVDIFGNSSIQQL